MKRILSILCVLGLILPYVVHVGQLGWFVLNKSYIVKELCIQRDLEENTCQGNCHLKKEFKKVDSQSDESNSGLVLTEFELSVFIQNDFLECQIMGGEPLSVKEFPVSSTRPGFVEPAHGPPKFSIS